MASRKKKSTELQSQADPRAPLDSQALLAAAKPVLARLEKDLLARADDSQGVTHALKARHAAEKKAERTADNFASWRRNFVEQVAAAWFLSVVFVRTLEDRGLLERHRIAGEGALDNQKTFFAIAPSLSERDYLLTVFRELSHLPAAAALFDAKHNPVWMLAPSAEAAQQLLQLFRTPSDTAPAFRFGGDTRFLGDLYQDVSENVRKRYALLQTPRFVESFILDQTLDPAIERFGLDEATLIDPACGSGHFLLGAFERLLERRLEAAPGTDVRQAAHKALDAVAGTDINPYAIAIARFRLTLAFLERAAYTKLKDAPKLPIHLAVADSLLHNPQKGLEQKAKSSDDYVQPLLGEQAGTNLADWEGELFALEDPVATRDVLGKRYAAVVGNPPYITVKDAVLRERYRAMYSRSAAGKYSLAAPFCERFFQLGRQGASVGMITANSFMKREFGKKVIEEYLPSVNLISIVNTSGAYIPGHGTPTVLLFGTSESPVDENVLTVLASRGEPTTPDDPEQGLVWRSIADHWNEVGFENEYVSVTRTERAQLATHPWSLGGGGATELKAFLEARAHSTLGELTTAIGFDAIMGEDEVFVGGAGWLARHSIPREFVRPFGEGENVRDWSCDAPNDVLFPYDAKLTACLNPIVERHLWPFKTNLINRRQFGKNTLEAGLQWFEYRSFYKSKRSTPLSITFAFVATHNHFVLDRGGKVFKQSAPIIKLPESATEDDHYALLAYLNSSTACFWMKQEFYPKGSAVRDAMTPENNRYEFAGTGLERIPLPSAWSDGRLAKLGKYATALAEERETSSPAAILADVEAWTDLGTLQAALARGKESSQRCFHRLVFVQEELDWLVYSMFGISDATPVHQDVGIRPEQRPYSWDEDEPPTDLPNALRNCYRVRRGLLKSEPRLALVENAVMKRLWRGTSGDTGRYGDTYADQVRRAAWSWCADRVERVVADRYETCPVRTVVESLRNDGRFQAIVALLTAQESIDDAQLVRRILEGECVPNCSWAIYTQSGLEKRAAWERLWSQQRDEDRGKVVRGLSVPPYYSQGSRGKVKDFLDDRYWHQRGKLDVPKERFISYPGCESDEDGEPVYGWAGWNHRQRAVALATLYTQRKTEEGWQKERLQPMLAGLLELLPWLDQWHNEPDAEFDGAIPAVQFREFLDAECAEHGFTYDDLRNWRPPEKGRAASRNKAKRARKAS